MKRHQLLKTVMPKLLLSIAVLAIFPSPSCSTQTVDCTRHNDCLSEGTCVNQTGPFSCACAQGSNRNNCEINIDDCAGHTRCLNGGTCVDGANNFTCACTEAFIGKYCEHRNECVYPGTCASVGKNAKCRCKEGYAPDPHDSRRCEFLNINLNKNVTFIFGRAGSIGGIEQFSLNQRTVTKIQNQSYAAHHLAVMYRTNTMYWADNDGNINTAPIHAGAAKTVVLSGSYASLGLAFVDWIYNHLYFLTGLDGDVRVANLDGSMQKYLFSINSQATVAIIVDPLSGWMYWTDLYENCFERAALDGSQREIILHRKTTDLPMGLALDMTQNRLYYTTLEYFGGPGPGAIHSMNVDGSDSKLVFQATSSGGIFMFITTLGDSMYWTDSKTNTLYTANKCGGGEVTAIHSNGEGHEGLFTTQVVHFSKQPMGINYCENRIDGQCSYLCFRMPSTENETLVTKCACPDGRTLSSDQRTCT